MAQPKRPAPAGSRRPEQKASPTPGGGTRTAAGAPGKAAQKKGELQTPYLREVQDFFRQLIVTEKNLGLYPAHSKVVRESQVKLFKTTQKCLEATGPLRLQLNQNAFVYEEEDVYHEPEKSKSLSFRIYKDGVREINVLPDVTLDEVNAFVQCLKEARKVDEDEDDFITLFWEKDCTNIHVQLADDFINDEDLPEVPENRSVLSAVRLQRFKIPKQEKERLNQALEARKEEEDSDSTFEITEEESENIRKMALSEESYFPLYDFVDILLEVMVKNPDASAFSMSVKMLRTIISAVVEDLDFERAAYLMKKLSEEAHPGLTEGHRHQLREMLQTFTDKQTLNFLDNFLSEHDKLAVDHPIFRFMMSYPKSATESFCMFLRHQRHVRGLTKVLIHLGTGSSSTLAKHLNDPDPLIVRAVIGILLETDKKQAIQHLGKALKHPDESVRVHAAKTIMEKGDASIGSLFLPLLEETSKQLLNVALQFFSKVSLPEAYDRLEALVKTRTFNILDQKRQRLCFKALLRASYSRGYEFISRTVLKRSLFTTKAKKEKQSTALLALSTVDTFQVRELLEKFAGKKKGPLAAAARRALNELNTRQKKRAQMKREHKQKSTEVGSV